MIKALLSFVPILLFVAPASAQPRPTWDSKGWVLLGETTVHGHGKLEHDRIDVGRQDGKFSKLTVVVENSDLELVDFTIKFGHGEPWHPEVSHFFREGQRTRVIDFPETAWGTEARSIKSVEFAYRNVPGEGHAHIAVWGWKTGDAVAAPPPAAAWDSRGWVMLGDREVHGHGKMERDRIDVGRQDGKFSKLTIVVENSDLELVDFNVKFGHGEPWHPAVTHFFKEGQRTRVIEFPETAWGTEARSIKAIEFAYRNIPGEGHARVQVWGWKTSDAAGAPAMPPQPAQVWESNGWTMLGQREVRGHGQTEHGQIQVGRQDGKFSKLTIVVLDSDLELIDMSVKFKHGDPWHPALKHFFKEGQRARMIELPASDNGNEVRTIELIDFAYHNLPGEGHARVQVWAQ